MMNCVGILLWFIYDYYSIKSKKELISMMPFKQKMFRQKPYTKCFECIQGNRLKCKKCMATLITNILQHKQSTDHIQKQNPNTQDKKQTIDHTPPIKPQQPKRKLSPEQGFEIRTTFGLWIDRMQQKRAKEYDPLSETLGKWPHKKSGKSNKIVKVQKARFQNWESRLLHRFSQNSPQLLKLQKHGEMR